MSYGVAKNTKLYAVKVLDRYGGGELSSIIACFQYVAQNRTQNCPNGSVANVSLGGPKSPSMNAAVCNSSQHINNRKLTYCTKIKALVQSGVFVAVSAGNVGDDGLGSPANEPSICTVGATDRNDTLADFSSFGPGVGMFSLTSSFFGTLLIVLGRYLRSWCQGAEQLEQQFSRNDLRYIDGFATCCWTRSLSARPRCWTGGDLV